MSKYLEQVIKEMSDYGSMGLPSGETGMGMGSVAPVGNGGLRGAQTGSEIKAYKLNDLLGQHRRAEEEEFDMENDEHNAPGAYDLDALKQFFITNPEPSDGEIHQYASDNNMDLDEMRKAVYALIGSLIGMETDVPADVDNDIADDEFDFSVSGDTGERPATNELDTIRRT